MIRASGNKRLAGFDLARSLAVFAMMIINFSCVFSQYETAPYWLSALVEKSKGRAAALFVLLAGIGISLLTRNARQSATPENLCLARTTLLKRSIFLFAAGIGLSFTWPGDILHYYGLYLLMAAFLFNAPDRILIAGAILCPLVFVGFLLITQPARQLLVYFPDWRTPAELLQLVKESFFRGCYPIFPWFAFILTGMWLGRQDLSNPHFRKTLLMWGIIATLVAETLSGLLTGLWPLTGIAFAAASAKTSPVAIFNLRHILGTAMNPPSPFFVLSAGGMALIALSLCFSLAETANPRWISPLASTGRMALTIYVGHVILGINLIAVLGGSEEESILFSVGWASAYYGAFLAFSWLWHQRFPTGPIEFLMRRFAANR